MPFRSSHGTRSFYAIHTHTLFCQSDWRARYLLYARLSASVFPRNDNEWNGPTVIHIIWETYRSIQNHATNFQFSLFEYADILRLDLALLSSYQRKFTSFEQWFDCLESALCHSIWINPLEKVNGRTKRTQNLWIKTNWFLDSSMTSNGDETCSVHWPKTLFWQLNWSR